MAEVKVDVKGVRQLNKELEKLRAAITDKKLRRRITRKAAKPIIDHARLNAPQLKQGTETYRYNTPKLIGRIRAPKGLGVKVATYQKGNLAGSIRALSLRRAVRTVIGPFVRKRGNPKGTFGPGARRFDAYYAQMVFGSAKAFQRKIMITALNAMSGVSISIIRKELDKQIKKNS